jgi:hypothetical protein
MIMLDSIEELLTHIQSVQNDVIELSGDSLLKMSAFIEQNSIEIDDNISTALQYQDIITQQLTATNEAIESMKKSMAVFTHAYKNDEGLVAQSMKELQEKLNSTLAEARDKKSRFSGKHTSEYADEEIEFF